MAQTKQQQQQLLMIYLPICFLVVVSLLMKVDSVSASSIQLDVGSGSMLQQQEHQQIDNNVQEHDYIVNQAKQKSTKAIQENPNVWEDDDDDDDSLNNKSFNEDLKRNHINFGHPFKSIAMVKRAPGGFVGMRGKKLYYGDDNISDSDNDISLNPPWNQLQNSDEDYNWVDDAKPSARRYKKAPTAFYGVRGKKFVTMNGINSNSDNQHWHDFLQKLEEERVRDTIIQDFVERLTGAKNDLTNDMAKRTPTGFTGVRGKRPFLDKLDSSMETLNKRGLGNNAFFGVRGKKDVSHQAYKRSLAGAGSLPGRNGKRQRFVDFNNKFVAVRGKKSSYNDTQAFNSITNNKSPSAARNLFYDKHSTNGFIGLRGKRPLTTDDI